MRLLTVSELPIPTLPVTTKDPPTPKLPVKLPVPTTAKVKPGLLVPIPTLPLFKIPTIPSEEPIKVFKAVAAPTPLTWSLATGEEVPIPTLLLKVSIPKALPLTLKALVAKVRLRAAVPEVEVKLKAPVDKVNPFWAVKVPPEVTAPLPVAEILPVVVILSPLYAGDKVVSVLLQRPLCPLDEPIPILPEQVKLPVVSSRVQPVEDDPPAKLIDPPDPGLMFRLVEATVAPMLTLPEPLNTKAVEVKVLVLIEELKVAAPPTVKPPVLLKDTAPVPEVVKLNPAVAISVEASKVKASLNWVKSKELLVIPVPGMVADQEALPRPSEIKI